MFETLRNIYRNFSEADAQRIKDIESVTNHDVKAVEYFLKEEEKKAELPDRIFIPLSPFSGWRRDMVGADADRLKRLFGDRIRFLNNACITV